MTALENNTTVPTGSTARAALARARSHIPAGPELEIWILSAAMIAAAAALFFAAGAGTASPIVGSLQLPFWALLASFAAAERFVVHIHFRRSAHSMSLAEIPLVFGLVFATGRDVILAAALGRLIILALHRRLPALRLAFNLGQFLLGTCLAVLVFHAVTGPQSGVGPVVWAAAALATCANSVSAVLLISVAVSVTEGRLSVQQVAASLRTDLGVVLVNTSIGLCAARLAFYDWRAAILMAVPLVGMFCSLQAYATERRRHGRLEFLYEAARALSRSSEIGPALEGLLIRALEAFRAEAAEIVFFSPDGADALRTTVRADGTATIHEGLDPAVVARFRTLLDDRDAAACSTATLADSALADYLESRQLGRGMFAVLEGERSRIGAIMIGNPSGGLDHFCDDDVRLFETLATNTSVALENERLGQTVWRMKQLQRELEHQASHDPLTNLANRLLFSERVGEALHDDSERVSVIFIDVDDFKTVNDSLGHAAGDELLVAIAARLDDCVRPQDTLARLGGDEFAIMLERGSSAEAIEVAERIHRRLSEPFAVSGQRISVRASAGIAGVDGQALTPEELIRNADVAMYRAKQASKHGYQLFESGMEVPVRRRHGVKQRLRDAVREDGLAVHYQPIVALDSGQVTAYEALVRWLDGPRGCTDPASFIPVAEEMGVIVPLGRSVLRRACCEARRWAPSGPGAPAVHVNVSPVELCDPEFPAGVADALRDTGLPAQRLVLEVTEGAVMDDLVQSVAILEQLRELGVVLALDDFGTGYSSLRRLRALPVEWLKVGEPFVHNVGGASADRPFLRMILELASDLGLRVIAEGVESRAQLTALRELGCGFGQGFHLGPPAAHVPSAARLDRGSATMSGQRKAWRASQTIPAR